MIEILHHRIYAILPYVILGVLVSNVMQDFYDERKSLGFLPSLVWETVAKNSGRNQVLGALVLASSPCTFQLAAFTLKTIKSDSSEYSVCLCRLFLAFFRFGVRCRSFRKVFEGMLQATLVRSSEGNYGSKASLFLPHAGGVCGPWCTIRGILTSYSTRAGGTALNCLMKCMPQC